MQMVQAKCILAAWDSTNCVQYTPGQGPLPGGLYEIDREGPLAKLKISGKKDAMYVFEFDRNANPEDKPHDYSCKKDGCGKSFKSLAALGSHTRSEHKDVTEEEEEDDDEVDEITVRTCFACSPPKVLKNAYGLRLHTEKTHPALPPIETQAGSAIPA